MKWKGSSLLLGLKVEIVSGLFPWTKIFWNGGLIETNLREMIGLYISNSQRPQYEGNSITNQPDMLREWVWAGSILSAAEKKNHLLHIYLVCQHQPENQDLGWEWNCLSWLTQTGTTSISLDLVHLFLFFLVSCCYCVYNPSYIYWEGGRTSWCVLWGVGWQQRCKGARKSNSRPHIYKACALPFVSWHFMGHYLFVVFLGGAQGSLLGRTWNYMWYWGSKSRCSHAR